MISRAEQLRSLGQSVWLDFIRRGHLVSGEFDELVAHQGVCGVTSNPTIFHQAITQGDDYDVSLRRGIARGLSADALFDSLAIEDIQMACDHLREVYRATASLDGRVSIEVSPRLAGLTRETIDEARRLHRAVARPNLMVKIPATAAGLPAIRASIADGICINVTLIFSIARYEEVMNAYLEGLEERVERGLPIDHLYSVASFFVSRVDTKIDKAIDEAVAKLAPGDPKRAELESLRGQAAVANARLAYARFQEVFGSQRFIALAGKGAHVQRPLWASTSTKNPAYRDTLYVDELIGADTVNTMPPQTLGAYNDHGVLELRIGRDLDRARALFQRLPELGIPIEAKIAELESEGVATFSKSYDQLIEALETRRREMHGKRWVNLRAALGDAEPAVSARRAKLERDDFARRLWRKDATLWSADPAHQSVARNRLGWLDAPTRMKEELVSLQEFTRELAQEGYRSVVLLGMGGSSLAPDVLRRTFGLRSGGLDLTVLDSTSPAAVRAVAAANDPAKTLFVVSSKSGSTLEVSSFEKYFYEWVRAARGEDAGRSFVAITDPGTPLEKLAATRKYRRVFLNPPDIGGRYSALSYFGLVPAALIHMDLSALLEHAVDEARMSSSDASSTESFGIELGVTLGELARRGRDKVTLVLGLEIASFGDWIEQLLAESTGKDGKGLIPITGEALTVADRYGTDRVFVAFSMTPFPREIESRLDELEHAGHPVLRWRDLEMPMLGAEFLRWEIATATAGSVLEVDPFDEPNVTEAKQATQSVLQRYLAEGRFPAAASLASANGVEVEAPKAVVDAIRSRVNGGGEPSAWAAALLTLAQPGDYFGILAYLHRDDSTHARLDRLRLAVRNATGIATTVGYGPRYLHSTGQLHKGGPPSGIFLQLTADEGDEIPIPGEKFGFGALIRAQSAGDYQVLERRGRRVMRVHLGADPGRALDEIVEAISAAHV